MWVEWQEGEWRLLELEEVIEIFNYGAEGRGEAGDIKFSRFKRRGHAGYTVFSL